MGIYCNGSIGYEQCIQPNLLIHDGYHSDLELDSEENAGLTAQPVRKNISLKLKTKSKSTSALGKSKKKESKSSDRKAVALEGE